MKLLLVLVTLAITGTCTASWDNLYLKYDILFNGYFPIEMYLDDLLDDDWSYMAADKELNVTFYAYQDDPRVAIGYDTYGNIAGVRVSYIIADIENRAKANNLTFPYTFHDKPIFTKGRYLNQDVYYTTVLFASPAKLKAGGRVYTQGHLAENIYVKINGKYTVMPRKEKQATSLGFVKQGCFLGMGRHYFLGTSNDTKDCNDLQGVFLLYDNNELIGMGLIPFGTFTSSGQRTWFEDPPAMATKIIVPDRPACLTDWVTKYGSISLHLFFNNNPRFVYC